MSALVRTIRKAILGTAANRNQALKTALESLGITPGQSDPHAMLKVQKIILNAGRDDEVQLRRALSGLNVTGGGVGSREASRIQSALLRSGGVPALREAIDDLITLEAEEHWTEGFRSPAGDLPFAAMDFVNGNYWLDGEDVAVTAMLGDGGDGNFRQESITAAGMEVEAASGENSNRPFMSQALFDEVIARVEGTGLTCVCEFDNNGQFATRILVGLYDELTAATDANEAVEHYRQFVDPEMVNFRVEGWSSSGRAATSDVAVAGVKKTAFNMNRPAAPNVAYDISIDGAAASTNDELVDAEPWNLVAGTFGFDDAPGTGAGVIFKSIAFYDIQPVADLDNLSTA